MVRRLLGNVVSLGAVWVIPVAREDFTEYGVERLLDSTALTSVAAYGRVVVAGMHTEA